MRYRRLSELLKDLENTGRVTSKTGSKGQKGYSSEFCLVVDPEIIGDLINKKWWKEKVVDRKKTLDKITSFSITKSNPYYNATKIVKKQGETEW